MKACAIILLLLLNFEAFGQLRVEGKSKKLIIESEPDMKEFVAENDFDYALLVWHFQWVGTYSTVYGLFKQQDNWYLAKMTTGHNNPLAKLAFTINQRRLNKAEADSALRLLNSTQAFKYKQEDFNQLPKTLEYWENGHVIQIIEPSDADSINLLQHLERKTTTLRFYYPDIYLKYLYPRSEQYGILKGFVNTANQLYTLTNNLSTK